MLKELDEVVLQHIGSKLFVKVHYGWGWQNTGSDETVSQIAVAPADFSLRVLRFFKWQGVWRGGVAKIEEAGHIYDGFWIVFYSRPLGSFNFTNKLTAHSLQIGLNEPWMLDPSEDPELAEYWPLWEFTGEPQMLGFGMIAVAPENIARWEEEHTLKPGQAHAFKRL